MSNIMHVAKAQWTKVTSRWIGVGLLCLLLVACAPATVPSPPMPTAAPALPTFLVGPDEQVLPALVLAEREASIQGDQLLLALLWAEDARIVDGRGTADAGDDFIWDGRAAILDRYVLAVFPSPPPPLAPDALVDATWQIDSDMATLLNQGDQWHFVRCEGRWWLAELVYNVP